MYTHARAYIERKRQKEVKPLVWWHHRLNYKPFVVEAAHASWSFVRMMCHLDEHEPDLQVSRLACQHRVMKAFIKNIAFTCSTRVLTLSLSQKSEKF